MQQGLTPLHLAAERGGIWNSNDIALLCDETTMMAKELMYV